MSSTIVNIPNSFVTFYEANTDIGKSNFITDSICGIQKDFCYPIYDEKDLQFQTSFLTDGILDDSEVTLVRVNSDGSTYNLTGGIISVALTGTNYNVHVNYNTSDLTTGSSDGDCFTLGLIISDAGVKGYISNQCFKKVADKCLTSKLIYLNTSNAFGFYYDLGAPSRYNVIRLPLYFKEPVINSDKTVYVRSNGARELLSARLSKRYKGIVDHVLEETHQNLVIALNHDLIRFVPEDYSTANGFQCRFEDEYNNDFPAIMQNVNIWAADFTIFETPFNNFNSNCE